MTLFTYVFIWKLYWFGSHSYRRCHVRHRIDWALESEIYPLISLLTKGVNCFFRTQDQMLQSFLQNLKLSALSYTCDSYFDKEVSASHQRCALPILWKLVQTTFKKWIKVANKIQIGNEPNIEMERYPGLSWLAQSNYMSLWKWKKM